MWRVTIRGLLAKKLRLLTTALAVMLGVAFMAGTLVLTDTMGKVFDDLFADVNRGTDAFVRGQTVFKSDFGDVRSRLPASLVTTVEEHKVVPRPGHLEERDVAQSRPISDHHRSLHTIQMASRTIALLIFDVPSVRSVKTIGISTMVNPFRHARTDISIWNA